MQGQMGRLFALFLMATPTQSTLCTLEVIHVHATAAETPKWYLKHRLPQEPRTAAMAHMHDGWASTSPLQFRNAHGRGTPSHVRASGGRVDLRHHTNRYRMAH